MERNEALKEKYPPFQPRSDIDIIHVHHQTTTHTIDQLLKKARETKRYIVDTESTKGKKEKQGALIQVQFIHSVSQSTIILIETDYLPSPRSILFAKIKELCAMIFNNNHEIISWGNLDKEFEHFHHLDLIDIGRIVEINLQSLFSDWERGLRTHPGRERRDETNDDYRCGSKSQANEDSNIDWSLQEATEKALGRFLDKSLTVNHWNCGLDLNLNAWKKKLFSRRQYNAHEEQQQRLRMKQYAADDCAVVAELYFLMYPSDKIEKRRPSTTTSTRTIMDVQDELSEISEDELIEILKPKFNQPKPSMGTSTRIITDIQDELSEISDDELIQILKPKFETKKLTIQSSNDSGLAKEITENEYDLAHEQELQPKESTKLSKSERQRKKNEKLKWKQKNRFDFQNKIKRPIYHRYDYHKIRSQLLDDQIYTSHQITINKMHGEVIIGFKSSEEKHRAMEIIRINYFSRDQYDRRWG